MYDNIMNTSKEDTRIILKIAQRASRMAEKFGHIYPVLDADLDITNCHANIPLRLQELLEADDSNFAHDVFGILRHIDRRTGKMEGCFLPRYAE